MNRALATLASHLYSGYFEIMTIMMGISSMPFIHIR